MIDANKEKDIFEELNRQLRIHDCDLTIICMDGYVLSHYGIRATHDIDGFFRTNKEIESIIRVVGDQFGLNTEDELWLNNSVQNLNEIPDETICDKLYEFSNLAILIPPLEYIAGMKLKSAREQDVKDVGSIVLKQHISTPDELMIRLERYGFNNIDESVLLEAFGEAYGLEWL